MTLLDISTPLFAGTARFPGDLAVRVVRTRSIDGGDPYNLSRVTLSSHSGTHIDPPLHFLDGAAPVDRIDLDVLLGACDVVEIPPDRRTIDSGSLSEVPPGCERVLFRTRNSDRWAVAESYFPDYVALTPDAADALVRKGVRLVGIDALSVEADRGDGYPVHHRLLTAGVLILEGVRLAAVAGGRYDLLCLPLRLRGGDGGPARAVLRTR